MTVESQVQSHHSAGSPEVTHRRRLLKALGAGSAGVAVAAATQLARPEAAFAVTTDVLRDQGGAVFNVRAYGATGNGTTNDATSIQSAINAAQSAGGGTVYFPQGTYLIGSTLTVTANFVSLVGAGIGAATLKASSTFVAGDMVYFNQVTWGRVENLRIDSTNQRTSGAAVNFFGKDAGIGVNTLASGHIAQNLWLTKQFIGIDLSGQAFLTFIDRIFINLLSTNGVGIWVRPFIAPLNGVSEFISNVFINGGTDVPANQPIAGIRVQSTGDFTLRSISLIFCRTGLLIDPPAGRRVEAGFVSQCLFDSCGDRGIDIRPAAGAIVQNLGFVDNWTTASYTYDGFLIAGDVNTIQVTNHRAYMNASFGFIVDGGGANRVFIDNSDVSGNIGVAGIAFVNTQYFAVRNCHTRGSGWANPNNTQDYGIRIYDGCDHYVVTGNMSYNNSVAQLSEPSAANRAVANNVLA